MLNIAIKTVDCLPIFVSGYGLVLREPTVVGLGTDAFADCAALEEADVACDIGVRMFRDCVKLTNLTLGNTVTAIGDYAFDGCVNLKKVNCEGGLASIGKFAINSERDFRKTQQKISNNIENSLQMIA